MRGGHTRLVATGALKCACWAWLAYIRWIRDRLLCLSPDIDVAGCCVDRAGVTITLLWLQHPGCTTKQNKLYRITCLIMYLLVSILL